MERSMYALSGNVKARARSSPALTDRSCVTDTRRSLASTNPRCLWLIGDDRHIGPAIVDRMLLADQVEPHADSHDNPDRDQHRQLVREPVEVRHLPRRGGTKATAITDAADVRPEREDRRQQRVALGEDHDDGHTQHPTGDSVWPGGIWVAPPQHPQRREDRQGGESCGGDREPEYNA